MERKKPKATQSKKITYPAIVLDSKSKRMQEGELSYDAPSDEDVSGFGRYISIDVANLVVKNMREHLKKWKENQPYGVTFGKEHLLSILAQKDCEGIRFYFGERKKDLFESKSKYAKHEGFTLVAVGVDKNNKDLGTDGGYIIHDIPGQKKTSAKSSASATVKGSGTKVVEVVPPEP